MCNHEIGHIQDEEHGYQNQTEFINIDVSDLKTAQKLFSSDGHINKFCPNCGTDLKGLLEARIIVIKADISERLKKKEYEKKKADIAFNKEVEDMSIKTKLNLLPEGNFIVLISPLGGDKRSSLLSGPKDLILRNCVNVSRYSSNKEIKVEKIYIIPNKEEVAKFLTDNGFESFESGMFVKREEKSRDEISFSSSDGIVYGCKFNEDEEKDYYRFGINRLGEHLNKEFLLKTIELN